jgi:sodium-coupled neutral amino acid transporter 11
MLLAFIIASMLALSGYLLFFTDAAGNILDNFAKDDRLVVICRVLLGVNVLFSIPYSVLMPRVVVQSLIKLPFPHLVEKSDDNRFVRNAVHTIVTVILQVAAVVLALHVTDLGLFYEIVGGMSAICVSLVIPPIIYLSISNTEFEANPISPLLTVGSESNSQPEQSEALTLEAIRQHKNMRFRCYVLLALGVVGMAGCLGSIFFNQ